MNNHVFSLVGMWPSGLETRYIGLGANVGGDWQENCGTPFAFAGTISKLRFRASVCPGSGSSYTLTVQKDTGSGFVDTTMVLTIADSEVTATTTSNAVSFNAGDS